MARSGFFIITDLPFIVCKMKNESTQIKCKDKDSKSLKNINLLDLNQTNLPDATRLSSKNNVTCKDPTFIKGITTQYIFPSPVISGGWGVSIKYYCCHYWGCSSVRSSPNKITNFNQIHGIVVLRERIYTRRSRDGEQRNVFCLRKLAS